MQKWFAGPMLALMVTLTGCGTTATPQAAPARTDMAQAQAVKQGNWLGPVRFTAKVSSYTKHTPLAYLEITGKPLVGRTATDSYPRLHFGEAGNRRMHAYTHVLFGEDGKLYIGLNEKQKHPYKDGELFDFGDEFIVLGSYKKPASFTNGASVQFELVPGVELERFVHWDIAFGDDRHIKIVFAKRPAVVKAPAFVKAR